MSVCQAIADRDLELSVARKPRGILKYRYLLDNTLSALNSIGLPELLLGEANVFLGIRHLEGNAINHLRLLLNEDGHVQEHLVDFLKINERG